MVMLENKVVIITQGASGIGKATAVECLKKGAKVSLFDTDSELGEGVLQDLRTLYGAENSIFIKCDFTSDKDFEEAFRQTKRVFRKINVVINSCGIYDPVHWEHMFDVNVNGIIRGTKLGFRFMSKEHGGDGGVIVNVSSGAGLEYIREMPEYCASKHAIIGYSMSCAIDTNNLNKHGIRINVMCQGATRTPVIDVIKKSGINLSMLKFLEPEYVAEGILILVEDDNRNGVIMHMKEERKFHIMHQRVNIVETILPENSS